MSLVVSTRAWRYNQSRGDGFPRSVIILKHWQQHLNFLIDENVIDNLEIFQNTGRRWARSCISNNEIWSFMNYDTNFFFYALKKWIKSCVSMSVFESHDFHYYFKRFFNQKPSSSFFEDRFLKKSRTGWATASMTDLGVRPYSIHCERG